MYTRVPVKVQPCYLHNNEPCFDSAYIIYMDVDYGKVYQHHSTGEQAEV